MFGVVMRHNKDILWKGLMEWVFDDLLRFLFPEAEQVFDLKTPLSFMDKELAQICPEQKGKATVRFVDKLVKVKLRKRAKKYALVHLEVQGRTKAKHRPLFGERMFRYFNLIFAKDPVPLAAIAIFTGGDGHLLSTRHLYHFMNTKLRYQYNAINIDNYSEVELGASANPFAWVLLIAKQALLRGRNREQRLLEKKWFIFQKLYDNGLLDNRKLQAILVFMEHYIPFKDQEIICKFRERVDQLTGKKNTMDIFEQVAQMKIEEARQEGLQMGLKEGLHEGEKEAKEAFVRDLLAETEFSDEKIASLSRVSGAVVATIREQMRG